MTRKKPRIATTLPPEARTSLPHQNRTPMHTKRNTITPSCLAPPKHCCNPHPNPTASTNNCLHPLQELKYANIARTQSFFRQMRLQPNQAKPRSNRRLHRAQDPQITPSRLPPKLPHHQSNGGEETRHREETPSRSCDDVIRQKSAPYELHCCETTQPKTWSITHLPAILH